MNADEKIVLDAEILSSLDDRAFRARLPNGHLFTAFVPKGLDAGNGGNAWPGARIRVRMSPFDMSRGEITEISNQEGRT